MTPVIQGSQDNCAICQENMKSNEKIVQFSCNHFFHQHCISECKNTVQQMPADQKVGIEYPRCLLCRREVLLTFTYTQPYAKAELTASDDPLIQACRNNELSRIQDAYCEDNSIINQTFFNQNISGNVTLLDCAAFSGYLDIVKYLVEKKANLNSTRSTGEYPLYLAAQNGHANVVQLLLQAGANYCKTIDNGDFPLMIAAQQGYLSVIKRLIDAGATIDQKLTFLKESGGIPISQPINLSHEEIAKSHEAIQAGIQLWFSMNEGCTALIKAAEYGRLDIVKYLIDQRANIEAHCSDGSTAYTKAFANNHGDVLVFLRSIGAKEVKKSPAVESIKEIIRDMSINPSQYKK